jgi:hypothetical protein
MRWQRWIVTCLAVGLAPAAQAQQVTVGGQLRPRYELRDPVAGERVTFTSMRLRANLTASLPQGVGAFVQLQDVRFWGEETSTLTDFRADNFDVHQAYVEIASPETGRLRARVGRQEAVFGGQRLIGAVGWTQQGRAFDGVRLTATGPLGTVDVIGYQLGEASAAVPGAREAFFTGAYATFTEILGGALDVYTLYDRVGGAADSKRATLGVRLAGGRATLSYRLEGSYQFGTTATDDIGAFMLGARAGYTFAGGRASVTLWYDYLSGDDDPTDNETSVFHTLFATNHKFYGLADLFTNIPAHTGGLGLQDAALKLAARPRDDVRLNADLHVFLLAKTGTLASGHLGEELDLTANYRYTNNLGTTLGFSFVLQDDAWAAIGRLTENLAWFYAMLDLTF